MSKKERAQPSEADKAARLQERAQARAARLRETLNNFESLPDDALVRMPVVRAMLGGVAVMTVYRWVESGRIPAFERFGPRTSGMRAGKLREALKKQAA